jgi:hypothetical protein
MMMIGVVEGREDRPLPHNIHPSTIHPSIFHPLFSCPKTNDADDLGEMTVDKIGTYHITLIHPSIHPSIYHPYCFPRRQSDDDDDDDDLGEMAVDKIGPLPLDIHPSILFLPKDEG